MQLGAPDSLLSVPCDLTLLPDPGQEQGPTGNLFYFLGMLGAWGNMRDTA